LLVEIGEGAAVGKSLKALVNVEGAVVWEGFLFCRHEKNPAGHLGKMTDGTSRSFFISFYRFILVDNCCICFLYFSLFY